MSNFEKAVLKLLQEGGYFVVQEHQFSDLYNGLYRFDFYCPRENFIVECNGAQHYQYSKFFHKKRSDFSKGQERDRRKIAYCLAHQIKLYIIPYWEFENLHTVDDLFREEFVAKDKFHNDIVWRQQKSKKI